MKSSDLELKAVELLVQETLHDIMQSCCHPKNLLFRIKATLIAVRADPEQYLQKTALLLQPLLLLLEEHATSKKPHDKATGFGRQDSAAKLYPG